MDNLRDRDNTFDPPEGCETEGCSNTALLRRKYPFARLCAECWEAQNAVEADRESDRQREERIFGKGA